MTENIYYGATTVVPGLHNGSGEVHNIAVDPNTPLPEFHAALLNSDYHVPVADEQPTAEGAVENSQNFRDAAKASWKKAACGTQKREVGFIVYNKPLREPDQVGPNPGDEMEIRLSKDAWGCAHTHPNDRQDDPSTQDIRAAKRSGKEIWVISRSGLWSVSPKGDVQHIYKSADWMNQKSPK